MENSSTPDCRQAELWMMGPVPPPVTGMTVFTQAIRAALEQAGTVKFFNWSPALARRGFRWRFVRNARILKSVAAMIARGRVRNDRLYVTANSRSGVYLTALVVFIASRLGYTVYLHHHVYYYIDDYDRRMAWINRRLAGRGVHVVHSEQMIDDFRKRYPTKCDFAVICPSVTPIEVHAPREAANCPFRLGLLSKLSIAKGLQETIDTFATLCRRDLDVRLSLAGEASSREASRLIERTIAEFPGHVEYLGPVYDRDKSRFFANIDAFVFPTHSESWGLVVCEAMAAGVPVIAFERGCLATVIGTRAGRLVDPQASFVEQAAVQIMRWMNCPDEYRDASQAAVEQATRLHQDGERTLAEFAQHMFSAPGTRSGLWQAT